MTPKQAAFCREYMIDCNGTAAAKRAGYSERTANEQAAELLAKPEIAAEIRKAQAELAKEARVTVQSLLAECEEARQLAFRQGQGTAAVAATNLKAQLTGLIIKKTEDLTAREAHERFQREQQELRTAGEIILQAAGALGLPVNATPAQIVGALSEHAHAPPDAFRILRAAVQAKLDEDLL